MAAKSLTTFLRCGVNKLQTRSMYDFHYKIGKREVVGPGCNNMPIYVDSIDFPLPAIRYKEVTPDIQVLKEKEKGDWKKLSIDEKKLLYRASFRQTFAELEAPSGEWKTITGISLIGISMALWAFVWLRHYVYPPLPDSFKEENRRLTLERMHLLDMQPISGLPPLKK